MSIYIVISFTIFLITDYIYLYNLFDSKIFLTKSGSKLNSVLKENPKINFNLNQILLVVFISTALFLLNLAITINYLNSNFVEFKILSKKINICALLQEKYVYFKVIYYTLSYMFFIILGLTYKEKVYEIYLKVIHTNKYDITSVVSKNDKEIFTRSIYKWYAINY